LSDPVPSFTGDQKVHDFDVTFNAITFVPPCFRIVVHLNIERGESFKLQLTLHKIFVKAANTFVRMKAAKAD